MGEQGSHPEVADLVAYHWGELPASRRGVVAAHLLGCPSCRRLLREHEEFLREGGGGDAAAHTRRLEDWRRLRDLLPIPPSDPTDELD